MSFATFFLFATIYYVTPPSFFGSLRNGASYLWLCFTKITNKFTINKKNVITSTGILIGSGSVNNNVVQGINNIINNGGNIAQGTNHGTITFGGNTKLKDAPNEIFHTYTNSTLNARNCLEKRWGKSTDHIVIIGFGILCITKGDNQQSYQIHENFTISKISSLKPDVSIIINKTTRLTMNDVSYQIDDDASLLLPI